MVRPNCPFRMCTFTRSAALHSQQDRVMEWQRLHGERGEEGRNRGMGPAREEPVECSIDTNLHVVHISAGPCILLDSDSL